MAVFLGEDALEIVICHLGDVSEPRGQQTLERPPVVLKWCWADCWTGAGGFVVASLGESPGLVVSVILPFEP